MELVELQPKRILVTENTMRLHGIRTISWIISILRLINESTWCLDSAPSLIFQPIQKVYFGADRWLLDLKFNLTDHADYIREIKESTKSLKTLISDYHTATVNMESRIEVISPITNLQGDQLENDTIPQPLVWVREGSYSKIRQRERNLMLKENELIEKEYDYLVQSIAEIETKYDDIVAIFTNLDPDRNNKITMRTATRKKRFIGILGALMGYYSISQINDLKTQVKLLRDNTDELIKYQQKTYMWISQSTKLTDQNGKNIHKLNEHMAQLTTQIEEQLNKQSINNWKHANLAYMRSILKSGISLLSMITQHLRDTIQDLGQQLSQCIHGDLPLSMISFDKIMETIEKVNTDLSNGKELAFTKSQLRHLMKTPVLVYSMEDEIHLLLSFPILKSRTDIFQIYKLYNMPIYVGDKLTQFILPPGIEGFAVDEARRTYKLLTNKELQQCSIKHISSCMTISVEFREYGSESCIQAYYAKKRKEVEQYCKLKVLENPPPYLMHEIEPNKFIIFTSTVRILKGSCPDRQKSQDDITLKIGTSIVTLLPGCKLDDTHIVLYGTETFHSHTTLENRNSLDKQIAEYRTYIEDIDVNDFEIPPQISLPRIHIDESQQSMDFLHELADDLKPIMSKEYLQEWDDSKNADYIIITAIVLIAITIITVMAVALWYYQTNKSSFGWISNITKSFGFDERVDLLKAFKNLTAKENVEKSTNQQFEEIAKSIDSSIADMQSTEQKLQAAALTSFRQPTNSVKSFTQSNPNIKTDQNIYPRLPTSPPASEINLVHNCAGLQSVYKPALQ